MPPPVKYSSQRIDFDPTGFFKPLLDLYVPTQGKQIRGALSIVFSLDLILSCVSWVALRTCRKTPCFANVLVLSPIEGECVRNFSPESTTERLYHRMDWRVLKDFTKLRKGGPSDYKLSFEDEWPLCQCRWQTFA